VKSWWLVIALLLSLGINLGILAAVGANRWGKKPPRPPLEEQPLPPPIAGETPQRAIRLADRLGLEGEQRRRFIARQGRFFVETVQLRTDMAETQRELRRELTAPQPDHARIDVLLNDSARSFRALEQAMAQNVVESRKLLNPDQEKEFLQFVALLRPPGLGAGNAGGRRDGGGDARRPGPGPGQRQQRPPRGDPAWGEERPRDEGPETQGDEPGEAPPRPPPERWQGGQPGPQGQMGRGDNAAQPPFRPRRRRGPWWNRRFGGPRPLPPVDGTPETPVQPPPR
jgi:Spy/CpxP family protein refolding chaperone